VIASASTSAQRVVTGTLADLPDLAAAGPGIDPPATLICGPSVALAQSLAWFVPERLQAPTAAAESS
jgi:siroheme synthase